MLCCCVLCSVRGAACPWRLPLYLQGGFLASSAHGAADRTGGDVSVGNALRAGLAAVLRSRVPSSVHWRERIVLALQSLGADDTAANMIKYIERQEWKERRCGSAGGIAGRSGQPLCFLLYMYCCVSTVKQAGVDNLVYDHVLCKCVQQSTWSMGCTLLSP